MTTKVVVKHASRRTTLHRPSHFLLSKRIDNARNEDHTGILTNPHFNKGTAFSLEERRALGLEGLLPAAVETLEVQVSRCMSQLSRFSIPLAKHIYLNTLRERNETLFFAVLEKHLEELLPYVYTPTVGQACVEYGMQYRQAEGMYITKSDVGRVSQLLDNWHPNILNEVSIIVVTDGSRVLGLGDLGAGGMGIPVGKLSLYVAAGGFHPATTLPVVIDVGTNNEDLLKDPFYLGCRHPRLEDTQYYALMDEFMRSVKEKWPRALVQFEDISNNHCFQLLETYADRQLCFNDDIQGTGAVIAAGFLNAIRITKCSFEDCRIVFVGAGSAGIGVVKQIARTLAEYFSVSIEMCMTKFYMVDSKGLVTTTRPGSLESFKKIFARSDFKEELSDLVDIVKAVKPSALIGLSAKSGLFTSEILSAMGEFNQKPIVFALSNPTAKSECTFEDALKHTNGRVLFAAGSPFPPMNFGGRIYRAAQGNNLYAFPGLGFGAWLSGARKVSESMISAATMALADSVSQEDLDCGCLYPPLNKVAEVSTLISARVLETAIAEGLSESFTEPPTNTVEYVQQFRYKPVYLEMEDFS